MTLLQRVEARDCGCEVPAGLPDTSAALARIAARVEPVAGEEMLPLGEATGRILARPVVARSLTPPFDSAAMDGYAVRSDVLQGPGPWRLRVAARIAAGQGAPALAPGEAARIFTGAPVPDGADAVIRQEDVTREGDWIMLRTRPEPGRDIRPAGEDMRPGQTVLAEGLRLTPCEIAAAAAAGAEALCVRRQLRVCVLVTGDEIRRAGEARDAAAIWDVNTPMLRAALSGPEVELLAVDHANDRRAPLRERLAEMATTADLVVTTGGLSVGEEDHVWPVLEALGVDPIFRGVAMKPGKPVSAGRVGRAVWLGLPGTPLAAFVAWQLFGRAVVAARLGLRTRDRRLPVVTAAPLSRDAKRTVLRPARLLGVDGQGRQVAEPLAASGAGRVAALPEADGLLIVEAGDGVLPKGARCGFLPFCQM